MTIVERFKQARKQERPSWGRFVLLVNELAPTADPQTVADNIRSATGLEYNENSRTRNISIAVV